MIHYVKGSLFESTAQTLVNPVNTIGVMEDGLARQFRDTFPSMFVEYRNLCELKKLQIGRLHLYKANNKFILNFPTRKNRRDPSKKPYIEQGLSTFAENYNKHGITSIALPLIGCYEEGLDWENQVKPLVEWKLRRVSIDIYFYTSISPTKSDVLRTLRNGHGNKRVCESFLIK
jgi:O-acetyl-ADP-ribose deacetylase (regulator of RNase III)